MDIISETWQAVKGFEGFYEVSNLGNVRRVAATSNGTYTGRQLKANLNTTGYYMVSLFVNNKAKHMYIHRLVAEAFIGNRPEGCQINHKDGNKLNNYPSNLEYVTPKQNVRHAYDIGIRQPGEGHNAAKLTTAQVFEIIEKAKYARIPELAHDYKVTETAIRNILIGKSWQCLPRPNIGYASKGRIGRSKLAADQVRMIVSLAATHSQYELADMFAVGDTAINKILTGRTWCSVTGIKRQNMATP